MKKITVDFSQLEIQQSLFAPPVKKDLQKEVADAIWQRASSVAESSFAHRLFDATPGPIELSEEEIAWVRKSLMGRYQWFVQAVNKAIDK